MDPPEATDAAARRRQRHRMSSCRAKLPEFILILTICFATLSSLYFFALQNDAVQNQNTNNDKIIDLPHVLQESSFQRNNSIIEEVVTSGVGLVTTDGKWNDIDNIARKHQHDIKMLGFTDANYVPIAKVWYNRLTKVGYKEHYIVANEKKAYDDLISENFRVLPCFVDNRDRGDQQFFRQIMAKKVKLARDLVRNGTHVLMTDVDNVFSRYINLAGFVEEGYDVYHSYEMRFPLGLYHKHGFVLNGGLHFFRSSDATMRFLDKAVKKCGEKCDDQVMFNNLFWSLDIEWDGGHPPSHPGAMRIASDVDDGLLVESATGRARATNHTIKIWDRDFAWRGGFQGIPESCPSEYNWVGMPAVNTGEVDKIQSKLALFDIWDSYCLKSDEKRVKMTCKNSIADCSLCKSPWCKTCWTDLFGQEKTERTCIIMDSHATKDPFDVKDVVLELTDGGFVQFCGSNKFKGTGITCYKRAQYMAKRYHMSEQDAKISLLENLENSCRCAVNKEG